ncbi:hypothetical protein TPHA_0H01780 [Tetrapisispora phaffii CBS 4417]|uniref:Uncharacterized protein n=1 Tax=Tetrapisispora phaffii (strain ATCC 24235 / CBS 4417 / NBRC 1672 / NRRL Y-8282 / UCD 70-5) TaxID=1071381 RepID=G8BX80_TETPH|nr:hypothetical protein TPHA_0H01780 [Tetrapisispora phaffii CBS 4417]CCE64384.1 hypothetical protein TPHA_0H01780 [Tetrapisispora phaffii CBS 4417]
MSSDKPVNTDERFSGVFNDPKFKNARKKNLKIKLDSRFSKSDLEVNRKARVDKYGRKISNLNNQEAKDFDKYFEKEEDGKGEEIAVKPLIDRARGEVPSDYQSSLDDYTSSESEDSEDEDLESEGESEAEIEETKPESGDSSKTIAVVNLDWDHVKATDLLVTFSSFVPKGGKIERIAIFPSEFGKQRMEREELEGPPKELFQKKKKKNSKKSNAEFNDDSDVDINDLYEEGDVDKEVDSKSLRQYQLDRLRYYYAVVFCNNISTAEAIYNNCDGTEYESTANVFDLRYVPDGMDFEDQPYDECTELPKNYTPLNFTTDALQHSNVKLTWDETPADRVEIAKRAFTQKEIDEMDFKAYLASDSEESEGENEEVKNKLKSLVGLSMKIGDKSIMDNKSDNEDGEVDMEITFTPGLAENDNNDKEEENEETTIEKVRRKEKERRKARKQKLKEIKQNSEQEKREKLKSLKTERSKKSEDTESDKNAKAELELLMMDEDEINGTSTINKKAHFNMKEILRSEKEKTKKSKFQNKEKIVEDNFKADLNDPRFNEMFEDHDFAIDPTQSEYKETAAMKEILKERSKRSTMKKANRSEKRKISPSDGSQKDISNIVNKLKNKNKKSKR